ncbi:DedA family protein [Microbacterium sp. NPDC076895]|uniref:DedA family protein n=1 Tax=unclassified Microbacterium TaxID=2609290 RepID=UPI0034169C5C
MYLVPLSAAPDSASLGGIVGFAAALIDRVGEWGVGLFTLIETVFPPIPSEIVLPMAGYLTQQGSMNVLLLVVTSTLGAYVGGLILYGLGAWVGMERSIIWLSKLPLVDREDFERAAGWFSRHGRAAVFFGRLIPGVRSMISLPAGAARMPLLTFSVFTLAGSAVWNALLIGLGAALGTQYELIDRYSTYLNYVVYAGLGGAVLWLIVRSARRARRTSEEQQGATGEPDC